MPRARWGGMVIKVFESISQGLYEIMMFSILGFFLAALYEPLRIVRLFVKTGTVMAGIQDFLFLAACGLIVFAYSLEFGDGNFRFFYIIGIVFGGAVYFVTLGSAISFVTRKFANAVKFVIKRVFRFVKRRIAKPLWKTIVNIAQKIEAKFVGVHKVTEKHRLLLKNIVKIKYNSIKVRMQRRSQKKRRSIEAKFEIQESRNEVQRNVIKARVIKRT